MPKGPHITEIFAQGQNGVNAPFSKSKEPFSNGVKDQPVLVMSSKKNFAPLPPMNRLGGFKPKILGDGGNDIIPISSQQTDSPTQHRPHQHQQSRPVLTKPKPFIIGDKDTPMTLSTLDDDLENSNDVIPQLDDMHIYDDVNTNQISPKELNNNVINSRLDDSHIYNTSIVTSPEADVKHSKQETSHNDGFVIYGEQESLINKNRLHAELKHNFSADNPVFYAADNDDSGVEPEPEPDYEEEEQCMDFAEEDPDELLEDQRRQPEVSRRPHSPPQRRQHQDDPAMKTYDGEDLSQYLSDDDFDDQFVPQYANPRQPPARLSDKHSMFKTKPQHYTVGKQKSSKTKKPTFSSVRNFSFADSKHGSGVRSTGILTPADDYSGFLSSKSEDHRAHPRDRHSERGEVDPRQGPAFPQWKQSDGSLIKKLTVRLRKHKQRHQ